MALSGIRSMLHPVEPQILSFGRNANKYLEAVPKANVSNLTNGVKVATEKMATETATVGVWIDAGSRWETAETNGTAHFVEHLNFKGTPSRSKRELELFFEKSGAHLNAYTARETTVYIIKCFKEQVAESIGILGDVLQNSSYAKDHVELERSTICQEIVEMDEIAEEYIMDRVHELAFPFSSLGRTICGTPENVQNMIQKETLHTFVKDNYTAGRVNIVATGNVDHDIVHAASEKAFCSLSSDDSADQAEQRYYGGKVEHINPVIPHPHMAIAFKTPGFGSPDTIKLKLIHHLLGNYDRSMGHNVNTNLSTDLGAKKGYIHYMQPFHHLYRDVGLFGVHMVMDNRGDNRWMCSETTMGACRELVRFGHNLYPDELEKAKDALKLELLHSRDGTTPVADHLGKSLIYTGCPPDLVDQFSQIDAITEKTIEDVVSRVFWDSEPVCIYLGPGIHTSVSYTDVKSWTADRYY